MEGRKEFEEESSHDEFTTSDDEMRNLDWPAEEPQEPEEMVEESQKQRQPYLYSTGTAALFQPLQPTSGSHQNEFPAYFRQAK